MTFNTQTTNNGMTYLQSLDDSQSSDAPIGWKPFAYGFAAIAAAGVIAVSAVNEYKKSSHNANVRQELFDKAGDFYRSLPVEEKYLNRGESLSSLVDSITYKSIQKDRADGNGNTPEAAALMHVLEDYNSERLLDKEFIYKISYEDFKPANQIMASNGLQDKIRVPKIDGKTMPILQQIIHQYEVQYQR